MLHDTEAKEVVRDSVQERILPSETRRSSTACGSTRSSVTRAGGDAGVPDLEKADTNFSLGASSTTRVGSNGSNETLTPDKERGEFFPQPISQIKVSLEAIVDFDGLDDPYKPINWPFKKKVMTTVLYGLTAFGPNFASSVYGPIVSTIMKDYNVGNGISILGISFLLAGFGLGGLLWGPFSEMYGRKLTICLPLFMAAIFSLGTATAKDIQTILITRFFTGLFGAAAITVPGGVLSDIWYPTTRGTAHVGYAMAKIGGPILGPIVGGAIITTGTSWRWTQYSTTIYMMVIFVIDMIVLDETYTPVLLQRKAARLRSSTGNWALHTKHDEVAPSWQELAVKFGRRPFEMLLTPVCFFVALYGSFVYGIFYANLASFPITFQEERGWNPFVGSLPFLSLLVGIIIGGIANVLNTRAYNKRYIANGNKPVPEARLFPMMGGSFIFAGGLFLFGWTSSKEYHWIYPIIATVMIGFGFFTIFQGGLNYLLDTFQMYAASALAANTFLRSSFAMAFPIFVKPMFHHLGIDWASTVFALFAVILIPVPFVFYVYGPVLRKRGKYSANMG